MKRGAGASATDGSASRLRRSAQPRGAHEVDANGRNEAIHEVVILQQGRREGAGGAFGGRVERRKGSRAMAKLIPERSGLTLKRSSRQLFPTPESPMRTSLNKKS